MNKIIVLFSIAFLLSACSAGLESRMDRELRDIRSLQAEQSAAITDIRHDIRDLTGRLDEIQHHSQGKTSALESAIQQLGSRVPPPSGVPDHLLSLDDQRIASIQGRAADKYRNALKLLRTGDFENSHIAFTGFAKENPGTAFTDNAFFWSGISSMKLGRLERAIGEFSDVFEKYPAEDMVAPSLYYMADSLFTLGMGNDGVLTLQKLVEDHPDSEFAAKARERLKESKSSRR